MKKDTKQLLGVLIAEGLLIETIIWCNVNHWKVNSFLTGNAIFIAFVGFIVSFIMFINWAADRS